MTTKEHAERLRAELETAEAARYAAWCADLKFSGDHPADAVTLKERRDFFALDIGSSGAFMVRKADGAVFGIKGYGSPDYRKGIGYAYHLKGADLLTYRHKRGPFRIDMREPAQPVFP